MTNDEQIDSSKSQNKIEQYAKICIIWKHLIE